MKMLNGLEMAGYIQERQAKQVRGLRQAYNVFPKLAVVVTVDMPVINTYMAMKQKYGSEILVDVDIHRVEIDQVPALLNELNSDQTVHGIIVQLPLSDTSRTDEIVDLVAPEKDVDGLGKLAALDPATPTAILWLLAGYSIDLQGKKILVVGQGKLVGQPLTKMLTASGYDVAAVDRSTEDLAAQCLAADVIITATGSAGIITPRVVKQGTVVVDAGVASEAGKLVGDVAPELYDRLDLTITPQKGGVGPLTICALFDNVIKAAQNTIKK
jgi:methylenetetrahydrofolate dehydrogenase (NADP+)/methenyltetrahydrofolate cyclohydrolase